MPRTWPALLAAALLLACTDTPSAPTPAFELTDVGSRISSGQITARVYGSFRVNAGGGGVIVKGTANFPGHPPKGPGTCQDGLWINANGNATSGSATNPHPHCIAPGNAIEVVLEPISACFSGFLVEVPDPKGGTTLGSKCPAKVTSEIVHSALMLSSNTGLRLEGFTYLMAAISPSMVPIKGSVTAYAIDGSTLNDPSTPPKRVGMLSIDLSQYNSETINYFDPNGKAACDLDASLTSPCLNLVINAAYTPLPDPDGVGTADAEVKGFLWFTPSTEPYNYDAVIK